ncbi:universal stress protein UspA [Pseudarthrobacter sulfonivorans]|uniref:Universal stress protein UspA n=1 Tax=Pseudarthrobacter sulfonivorans TaxID=121292 RepID=A0A0U3QPT1_9MICC|nr:universal stress protein [Pseudarthrobacter sulfonivorans]ALV42356.1 universal stress protein UspA [Pseudarthrobacter sulfonivorans]
MDRPELRTLPDEQWPEGPVVLGTAWDFSEQLVSAAASLADGLDLHLVCAFVDPATYLTEWEPDDARAAHSLDPAVNEEAQFPSGQLLRRLESELGPPGQRWSFRVLNGDPAKALSRLAESTGAALIIVGGPRPEITARMSRLLEGSVSALLIRHQKRPVLVIPDRE